VPRFSGVDSEVGRLRAVIVHPPGSELCGARGGPRSLCCPVSRDPAPLPAEASRNL